jgi:hypothetical protein
MSTVQGAGRNRVRFVGSAESFASAQECVARELARVSGSSTTQAGTSCRPGAGSGCDGGAPRETGEARRPGWASGWGRVGPLRRPRPSSRQTAHGPLTFIRLDGPRGARLVRTGPHVRSNSRSKLSATHRNSQTTNPYKQRGYASAKPPRPGWGPDGRRFKSCLPDRVERPAYAGLFRGLRRVWGEACGPICGPISADGRAAGLIGRHGPDEKLGQGLVEMSPS